MGRRHSSEPIRGGEQLPFDNVIFWYIEISSKEMCIFRFQKLPEKLQRYALTKTASISINKHQSAEEDRKRPRI